MTSPDRDYDAIVRRALHAIVDPIEPAGDGLARIRERMAQPWLRRQVSLLRTESADLGWLIVTRCEPAVARARSWLAAGGRAAGKRLGSLYVYLVALAAGAVYALSRRWRSWGHRTPSARAEHGTWFVSVTDRARRVWGWLAAPTAWARPALAVAAVTVIVAAGAFGITQLRETLVQFMNGSGGGSGQAAPANVSSQPFARGSGQAGVSPSGRSPASHASTGYTRTGAPGFGASTSACSPPPAVRPTPSPSSSPTASPTSSPTDTANPTTSPTSSPTSGTPVPAGSVSAVKANRFRAGGRGSGGSGTSGAAVSAPVSVPCPTPTPQPSTSGAPSPSQSVSPTPPTGISTPPTPTTSAGTGTSPPA